METRIASTQKKIIPKDRLTIDTKINSLQVKKLYNKAKNISDFGAVTAKIKGQNYKDLILGRDKITKMNYVKFNTGCVMFFNRKTFINLGGFDESFFLYFEDTDFCYRVKKKYKVIYNPNSIIIHSKRESFKNSNIHVNYEFFKSLYVFYSKYFKEYNNFYVVKLFVKYILRLLVALLSTLNKLYKS